MVDIPDTLEYNDRVKIFVEVVAWVNKTNASDWIRAYIEEQAISREQVAHALGIPQHRLEMACQESLPADEFLALCNYLGVDLDAFVKSHTGSTTQKQSC